MAIACVGARERTRAQQTGERSAALARVVVDNRTELRLDISFRYAAEDGGEVGVGTAPPRARMEMAPVPADEPIILTARSSGFERRLGPRSFEIDELWVWVVRREGS
ncbi:MAG TPA: hypothetical protein VMM83_01335 [Longimicrobiales bacterium]|nr:hypothetical protein [Longimicrobiales bacterium]